MNWDTVNFETRHYPLSKKNKERKGGFAFVERLVPNFRIIVPPRPPPPTHPQPVLLVGGGGKLPPCHPSN